MDWQGIDWVLGVFELGMLVLTVTAFGICLRDFRRGTRSRFGALWRYSRLLLLAIASYVLFCALLLGIEEFFAVSVVSEGLARSFFFVIGLGTAWWLLTTLTLGLTLLLVKRQVAAGHSPSIPPVRD